MEDEVVLPEDVLIEILINLPVKSLMRCRCVSKNWCALIKSCDFISRHFEHGRNERMLLMRKLPAPPQGTEEGEGDGGEEVLSLHDLDSLDLLVSPNLSVPFLDNLYEYDSYDFLGASTGLVCVALTEFEILGLCNPALREFQELPPTPFSCPEGYHSFVVGSGFGYDARNNIYKVVQLWYTVHEDDEHGEDVYMRMDLFDSSTYSWRIIDAELPLVIHDPGFSLCHNGICHWRTESHRILAFHLSAEIFREFEYPDFEDDEKHASLVVLDGCLSLVRFGRFMEETVEIWVMREYGVKWVKEFEIGPYAFNCPLLVLRNEWLLVETSENQLAALALRANEMKRFHFHGTVDSLRAVKFTESLISVKLFADVAELVRMKAELESEKKKMRAQVKGLEDQLSGIDVNGLPLESQLAVKDVKDQLAGIRAKLGLEDQLT